MRSWTVAHGARDCRGEPSCTTTGNGVMLRSAVDEEDAVGSSMTPDTGEEKAVIGGGAGELLRIEERSALR